LLEHFLGVWDVAPNQDSGYVYVSAGREAGFVFQVRQAQINRYWHATPFTVGTLQPAGTYPRIVGPYGPPRVGRQYVVRDGNRATYSNQNCVWTLYITQAPPLHSIDPNRASIEINVDTGNSLCLTNPMGVDVFSINIPNTPGTAGQIWYLQMVVEEFQKMPGGVLQELGVFAASRGTWVGIALP
jgi:hypothetical protein